MDLNNVFTAAYQSPTISVYEVKSEQGFANSPEGSTTEDYDYGDEF